MVISVRRNDDEISFVVEETTDLRQVTDETFHRYGLCPVRGLNLGRSGVKESELRRDESDALAHRATAVTRWKCISFIIIRV